MLVIIFTYNRKQYLTRLLHEIHGFADEIIVIDDGSEWSQGEVILPKNVRFIRTTHSGKKGFWKKWVMAREIALGTKHDYFLFLPDDVTEVNWSTIEDLKKQGWEESIFAINVINCNRTECWGNYSTGQPPFQINNVTLNEVGFVDCGFFTNRLTMQHTEVHEVTADWFTRADISSGVGYQMSHTMRALKVVMMMPTPGLCNHSRKQSSVMHPKSSKKKNERLMTIHCINLSERPEKWVNSFAELKKLKGVPLRWNATKKAIGYEGCRESHVSLLQHLRYEYPDDLYGVFEDDVEFTHQIPAVRLEEIMRDLPKDWDILYLGATINERPEFVTKNLFRIKNAWTTHAMIFNNQNGVVDYILENQNSIGKIDVFYAQDVQHKYNCYLANPMLAIQKNGHSDIMNKYVPTGDLINKYFEKHTA